MNTTEAVTSDARALVGTIEAGSPRLDAPHHRFICPISMDVNGIGAVRGLQVGYFGRDSIVQIAFYCLSSDWDRYGDMGLAIVDSFRFDDDRAYSAQLAATNPSHTSTWGSALEQAAVGAVTFAIIGLIAGGLAARKRRASMRTPDPQDTRTP